MWWVLASVVVVVAVPLVLVVVSLNSLLFDPEFYLGGQARWAVGRTTEYSLEALRPINQAIVVFFSSPGLSLPAALGAVGADRAVFNAREVGHMEDVRSIVRLIGQLEAGALAVGLAIVIGRLIQRGGAGVVWAANRLLIGALVTLVFILTMGALTLVDFEQLFLTFHLLSFDNDLWQLDPRRDNLIRFFPFEFWFDATVTAALRTVLLAVALAGAALVMRYWMTRRTA